MCTLPLAIIHSIFQKKENTIANLSHKDGTSLPFGDNHKGLPLFLKKKPTTFSFDDCPRIKYSQGKHFYFEGHLLSVTLWSYLKLQCNFNSTISELSVKDKKHKVRRKFYSIPLEFRSSDNYQLLHYKRIQMYFFVNHDYSKHGHS